MRGKSAERTVRSFAPLPAIRPGSPNGASAGRYGLWLTVYLRVVALVWIGQGLLQWVVVLTDDGGAAIDDASAIRVTAVVFFCVLDLVAAVGLWMVTAWGVAVWFATVLGQIVTLLLVRGWTTYPSALIAADVVLVTGYFVVSWLASREPSTA